MNQVAEEGRNDFPSTKVEAAGNSSSCTGTRGKDDRQDNTREEQEEEAQVRQKSPFIKVWCNTYIYERRRIKSLNRIRNENWRN